MEFMLKVFIIQMSGVYGEIFCVFCIINYNFKFKFVEKNRSIYNIFVKMCIWLF